MPLVDTVLIVGAGPTGLTLAATLARSGVRARIIERSATPPDDRSRAIVIQARTLELFRDLGIDTAVIERGLLTEAIALRVPGGRTASVRIEPDWLTSRFNRILTLPQDETERALLDLLDAGRIEVERGVELEALETAPGASVALLRHADGTAERFVAHWVIGCDGAHSSVRHAAGIPFPGETYADEALLGDVDMEWDMDETKLTVSPNPHGFLLAFPLPGAHRFRVIMIQPAAAPPESRALSLEEFTASLREMMASNGTSPAPRVIHARWLTRYRLHRRGVPAYRAGRIFVAGDAAHIHSPVGAQGMNTGIQDAYNLGWKLALVARGEADEWILDSYHSERHRVGQLLLTRTDQVFGMLAGGGRASRMLRRLLPAIGVRLLTLPCVARRLATFVSQTRIRYAHSSLATEGAGAKHLPNTAPHAGDRLPDMQLENGEWIHDAMRGPSHVMLCIGGEEEPALYAMATEVAEGYEGLVSILHLPVSRAVRALAGPMGAVYLIRPDKHIGFRTTPRDAMSLRPVLVSRLHRSHP